ncbi:unnamed protein product [Brachionus calyciflorus]|uniref:Uncharacterized protein n=1 Tax=Brachionus calyciflorus TaxID=104777 RepID=A0A814CQA8_9BILA|nr:unnamed protein product [Brachionus calyciflorus]
MNTRKFNFLQTNSPQPRTSRLRIDDPLVKKKVIIKSNNGIFVTNDTLKKQTEEKSIQFLKIETCKEKILESNSVNDKSIFQFNNYSTNSDSYDGQNLFELEEQNLIEFDQNNLDLNNFYNSVESSPNNSKNDKELVKTIDVIPTSLMCLFFKAKLTQTAFNLICEWTNIISPNLSIPKNINDCIDKRDFEIGKIRDFSDGRIYNEIHNKEKKNFFTLLLNTDGIELSTKSKISIWPIILVINELSLGKRFCFNNIIIAGISVSHGKPNLGFILSSITRDLKKLEIGINIGKTEFKNIKFFLTSLVCDKPARGSVLNMVNTSGSFGCLKCLQPGKREKTKRGGTVQTYPFNKNNPNGPKRTIQSYDIHLDIVLRISKTKFGIKDECILSELKYFHPIRNTLIDGMHSISLGVIKILFNYWFDKPFSMDYSLKNKMSIIDERIKEFKMPGYVSSSIRSISIWNIWKSHEYLNFILIGSLSIFYGLMKIEHYNNLILLVLFLEIVYSKTILKIDLLKAHNIIKKFLKNLSGLYDPLIMKSGIHELVHICDMILDFGPINSSNCYQFEEINRKIIQIIKGQNLIGEEFIKLFNVNQSIENFSNYSFENQGLESFIKKYATIGTSNRKKNLISKYEIRFSRTKINFRNLEKGQIKINQPEFCLIEYVVGNRMDVVKASEINLEKNKQLKVGNGFFIKELNILQPIEILFIGTRKLCDEQLKFICNYEEKNIQNVKPKSKSLKIDEIQKISQTFNSTSNDELGHLKKKIEELELELLEKNIKIKNLEKKVKREEEINESFRNTFNEQFIKKGLAFCVNFFKLYGKKEDLVNIPFYSEKDENPLHFVWSIESDVTITSQQKAAFDSWFQQPSQTNTALFRRLMANIFTDPETWAENNEETFLSKYENKVMAIFKYIESKRPDFKFSVATEVIGAICREQRFKLSRNGYVIEKKIRDKKNFYEIVSRPKQTKISIDQRTTDEEAQASSYENCLEFISTEKRELDLIPKKCSLDSKNKDVDNVLDDDDDFYDKLPRTSRIKSKKSLLDDSYEHYEFDKTNENYLNEGQVLSLGKNMNVENFEIISSLESKTSNSRIDILKMKNKLI